MERKYNYTTAQLIDRLAIVTLKSIKIPENKETYEKEADEIMFDLDEILGRPIGRLIRYAQMSGIINEIIWANEAQARLGGDSQDKMLKLTHSLNGVRTSVMNEISNIVGGRKDLKIDCLAAESFKMKGYDFSGIL